MAAKPQSRVIGTVIPMPQNNLKKEFFHKQIAIPTQGKIELIDVDQILFLKSDSNYTEIHLVDGSTIVTSSTLKKYEAKLKKQKFMRVHNSYIIQRSQLKTFLPHLNKLILHNTQEIPVSRSRKEGIMKYLKMLMVSMLMIGFMGALSAQSFTQWQQGAASDYYVNIDWSVNTNTGCFCYYQNDEIKFYLAGSPHFFVDGISLPHSGSQSGPTALELGPNRLHNIFAEAFVYGGLSSGQGNCLPFGCESSANSSSIVMSTTIPRQPGNLMPTYLENGGVTFNWTNTTDIPIDKYTLKVSKNNVVQESLPGGSTEWTDNSCVPGFTSYSVQTVYSAETAGSNYTSLSFFTQFLLPIVKPLPPPPTGGYGQISGKILTNSPSPAGVGGVIVRATLLNNNDLGGCWPAFVESEVSQNSSGDWSINDIYYDPDGPAAQYEIEAFLDGHSFRYPNAMSSDSTATFSMTMSNHNFSNVNFIDITSYAIRGSVTSMIGGCGVQGVTILEELGDNSGLIPVQTQSDGSYEIIVPAGNMNYDIYAQFRFGTGAILDSVITVAVGNVDVDNVNFVHTATDTLRGFIGAGCQEAIGFSTLTARTPGDGCVIATINPNGSGYYEAVLPSRPLELEVTDIIIPPGFGLDENEVLNGFGEPEAVDFDSTTTQNFIYRRPLTVKILGLPSLSCAAIPHPVVEQRKSYFLTINVEEGDGCPVDTGKVMIFDNISTMGVSGQIVDSVVISQGVGVYELKPGDPNFFGDHTKFITFQALAGEQMMQLSDTVIVTGAVQSGNNFTTAAPTELPFLILRDPPGDQSYSEFIEENVTTISQAYSTQLGGGVKVWADAKVGVDIFGLEIWGQIGASFEINSSESTTEEFILEISNAQTFRTSDNENIVGEDGDVFVGAAVNFIYAKARTLDFNLSDCSFSSDTLLMLNANGFETTFIYTEDWIRNEVIPTRQSFADNETLPDSVRYRAGKDVNLWEQVLLLNEQLKEEALQTAINKSFNAGTGPISDEITISKTQSKTIEFTTQIDVGIAVEVGFEFMNNGVTAGVDVNFQTVLGEVKSTSSATTTTTSYHLQDGEVGDNAFTVNIAQDPVFGTPVFKLLGGQTSCPYEDGTQRLDDMTIIVDQPVQEILTGNEAFFFFDIISNSWDPDPRSYYLAFNSNTAGGSDVTYGGDGFGTPILVPNISPGINSIGTPIKVTKPVNLQQFDFEGLEFFLYPACEDTENYTTADLAVPFTMSAYFDSPCSDVDMLAPLPNWQIADIDNNEIFVTMAGYDLSSNFDQIELQYKKEGGSWQPSGLIRTKLQLNVGSTTIPWDVSDLSDGNYEVRFLLECGSIKSFSERVGGLIDRNAPLVFGLENPTNDRYQPGKEISVTFDEEINCEDLNIGEFYLMMLPQNEMVPAFIDCDGSKVTIFLESEIGEMYNQAFEVGLIGVKDMVDNQRPDTVKWQFVVSEPDSDDDGVPETLDICPGGNDFIDSDMDGLPDDCDCLPNDPSNGRTLTKASLDFDGVNDHIKIPHHPDLIPTATNAVTIETWIYPTESSNEHGIITQSGNWPNRNHQILFNHASRKIQITGTGVSTMLSNETIPYDVWSHIAIVYNLNETKLYINGDLDKTRIQTLSAVDQGNDLTIGNQEAGGPTIWNWSGKMDEMRYWDYALTAGDIAEKMYVELLGIETGLVAYYDFNEGTPFGDNSDLSTIVDKSMNGHDGTANNFVKTGTTSNWVKTPTEKLNVAYKLCETPCPDTIRAAIDFTGNADNFLAPSIGIPDSSINTPSATHSVTFEAWIKPRPTFDFIAAIAQQQYSGGTNYIFGYTSTGTILGAINSGAIFESTTIIPFEEWSHIALVMDQTQITLYINGQFELTQAVTFPAASSNFNQIRLSQGGLIFDDFQFMGAMDDVRLWDGARTAQEILNNYQTELIGDEPNLATYFNFNEGVPGGNNGLLSQAIDHSGNGLNANLFSFKKTGDDSNWVPSAIGQKDTDKDGTPDYCDACNAERILVLENQSFTSNEVFRAEDKIILGENLGFPAVMGMELKTKEVIVLERFSGPGGITPVDILSGSLIISPDGCEE